MAGTTTAHVNLPEDSEGVDTTHMLLNPQVYCQDKISETMKKQYKYFKRAYDDAYEKNVVGEGGWRYYDGINNRGNAGKHVPDRREWGTFRHGCTGRRRLEHSKCTARQR